MMGGRLAELDDELAGLELMERFLLGIATGLAMVAGLAGWAVVDALIRRHR